MTGPGDAVAGNHAQHAPPTRKLQAVNDTKRANDRLKRFQDTCLDIAETGGTDPKAREKLNRLYDLHQREFARNSTLGRDLKTALEHFEAAWAQGEGRDTLMDRAAGVEASVRAIRRERWRQVERRHGKIGHCFDAFGQIKPAYKVYANGQPAQPVGQTRRRLTQTPKRRVPSARGVFMSVVDLLRTLGR